MKAHQKLILALAGVVTLILVLAPPWQKSSTVPTSTHAFTEVRQSAGHHWLWWNSVPMIEVPMAGTPRTYPRRSYEFPASAEIAAGRLLLELAAVWLVFGGALYATKKLGWPILPPKGDGNDIQLIY